MKVSELFESTQISEAVDASISSLLPKVLIGRMFRIFNLDAAKSTMTKLKARPTAASALKNNILVTKTPDNEWIVAAYGDKSNFSFKDNSTITVFSNKSSQIQYITFAALKDMLKEKGATTYWTIPFQNSYYRTRGKVRSEVERSKVAQKASDKLVELQDIFGKKYKERALQYVDEIFANLRILSKTKPGTYAKTQREQALAAASVIEEMIEKDFNRSSMERFLILNDKMAHGWDSYATNEYSFNKLMAEPAANAKFALVFFKIIKALYDSVMEMVKEAKAAK